MKEPPATTAEPPLLRGPDRGSASASRILSAVFTVAYPLAVFIVLRRWPLPWAIAPKLVPALVNVGFLLAFALSLRGPQTIVERFARRREPPLSPRKVRYCRRVTVVWCGFFVVNIGITVALAVAAPLAWWSVYTGIVAYALMGALFAGEYLVRRRTFRDSQWQGGRLGARWPPRDDRVSTHGALGVEPPLPKGRRGG